MITYRINTIRRFIIYSLLFPCLFIGQIFSQTYKLTKQSDFGLAAGIIGLGIIDIHLNNNLESLTANQIMMLDRDDIWKIDRFATSLRSIQTDKWSDYTKYAAYALPTILLMREETRQDLPIVGVMLVEVFGLNAAITTFTKTIVKRNRPFTYNEDVGIIDKQVRSARKSFVSGHTSDAAALGFFTAKVFSDLHPHSKWKSVVWAVGAGLPIVVGGLRIGAGKHFLTDVLSGYGMGALIGYMIPHIHKRKNTSRIQVQAGANGTVRLLLVLDK